MNPFKPDQGSNSGNPFDFMEQLQDGQSSADTSWVEGFVKEAMDRAFRGAASTSAEPRRSGGSLKVEQFETHKNVIVKIPLPYMSPDIRTYAGEESLKLEGAPPHIPALIRFRSVVEPTSGRAVYRSGILQLTFRKRLPENRFHEIRIRY
ncbi:hypothetical protein [Paenibacillus tarimensis]|uniref:hypothetical protein n=1 Tax=Paenibacillus tarimensis TaxID=416012 RepID=UPI001F36F7BE|nr:hypothetical protein [Paenibacillus tarimensis]MCF2945694.1 hypothetical protein [Paenibacillus tarimensis]